MRCSWSLATMSRSSSGSRRWISARPRWCAASGCPARAARGGGCRRCRTYSTMTRVAAGDGGPAGRAWGDPGGDGGDQRLLEAAVLPAGGARVRDRGWSTPRTSSTCPAGRRPTGWTRCGCARSPSGRCCGPASCRPPPIRRLRDLTRYRVDLVGGPDRGEEPGGEAAGGRLDQAVGGGLATSSGSPGGR